MTLAERALRGAKNDWRLNLLSVFSVAVAFVCLTSSLLALVNVNAIKSRWENTGRISAYLKPGLTDAELQAIEAALRATAGVATVRYVAPQQAREALAKSTGDPLFDALDEEAFPAAFEVGLEQGSERTERVALQLRALPAVEAVETYRSWASRLGELVRVGVTATLLLSLVIFGAVVSVVSSTVRLTLGRRRMEVDALRLVGATEGYVRRPFVLEGAAQGAFGAVLALLLLGGMFLLIRFGLDRELTTLIGLSPVFLPWWVMLSVVATGSLLGASAAWGSLRRLSVV